MTFPTSAEYNKELPKKSFAGLDREPPGPEEIKQTEIPSALKTKNRIDDAAKIIYSNIGKLQDAHSETIKDLIYIQSRLILLNGFMQNLAKGLDEELNKLLGESILTNEGNQNEPKN